MCLTQRLLGAFAGLLVLSGASAQAGEVKVAVAANFLEPAQRIAEAFSAATGHQATLSFGSSGQLYAQIAAGAPYEALLSADAERPAKAEAAGLAVKGSRFTYAVGRLVLWSRTPGLVDAQGAVLRRGAFAKIAIADPVTAPYGLAAVQTLRKLGLYGQIAPKIVTGGSIAQAYQFVQTGAAEVGFVALSQVIDDKARSRWLVPQADYAPIEQQAVLLAAGQSNPAATAFLAFLKGPQARAIIVRYGYEIR